jgi:hypothetical protein
MGSSYSQLRIGEAVAGVDRAELAELEVAVQAEHERFVAPVRHFRPSDAENVSTACPGRTAAHVAAHSPTFFRRGTGGRGAMMLRWLSHNAAGKARAFSQRLEEFIFKASRIQLSMRLSPGPLRPRRASSAGMRTR